MNIQWYPGHMTKAKRMMQENIKLIDVVIELVDARVPLSSRNPDIDDIARNKSRIVLLNKADLADNGKTEAWKKWYEDRGAFVTIVNSKSGKGVKTVTSIISEACKEKIERDRRRGIINRPVRAMIVGIPNVGKSTFINSFAGKACTQTGNKPGVTKGKQWIRLNKNVELLDTPGILWPKFEDKEVGIRLALIGSIREEILNISELSVILIKFLVDNYQGVLSKIYDADETKDSLDILEKIAVKRCCKTKGDTYDLDRAASFLIDDFRSGKLGNISLEIPYDTESMLNIEKSE
ncbi:MAG: ribosome biogenesis GTPase YlqF [Lachnospiraceae bacterium]|nr:ribosome biogenesis GTPase YlqF [Lachnospiraceae bacterium]